MSKIDPFLTQYFDDLVFQETRTKVFVLHNLKETELSDADEVALAKMWAALNIKENELKNITPEEKTEFLTENLPLIVFSTQWPMGVPKPKIEKMEPTNSVFWADHFSLINQNAALKKKFWQNFTLWFRKFVA